MSLYDYQARAVPELRAAVKRARTVVYVLPTGGGKTVVAGEIARLAAARGTHTLMLVHRRELVQQAARTLEEACPTLTLGYEVSGMPSVPWAPLRIGMVQTIARREHVSEPGLVVVDEAHHVRAKTWENVLKRWPGVAVVGLTATPERLDGKGLGATFAAMVEGPTTEELVAMDRLAPVRVVRVPAGELDTSGLRTRGGDWTDRALDERVTAQVMAAAVPAYQRHTPGAKALFFGVNRRHSKGVAQRFRDAGISAEHVDGTDHMSRRDRIMGEFRDGPLQVVCNVGLVDEGFDAPACDAVLLGRKTRSLTRYLQAIGRSRRYRPGKTAVVLDLGGSSHLLGLPDDAQEWSLADGFVDSKKRQAAIKQLRECRACQTLIKESTCPYCGALQGVAVREKEINLEVVHPTDYRRRGRASRASMWDKLAMVRRSADPVGQLQALAAAHNRPPAWVAYVRRAWGI